MSDTHVVDPAVGRKADGSGRMFDGIARRYDFVNRLMSLGLDGRWRRTLVAALPAGHLLDVATGTADVALALVRRDATTRVTGLDPSAGMLAQGAEKVEKLGFADRITLIEGDAQQMPFADHTFAGSCISFGIRNVPDRRRGLAEMARVTVPGGPVAVLELTEPQGGLLAPFARFHVRHVVPRIGGWLSGNAEYRYLQRSVAAFPPPQAFAALMAEVGLVDVQIKRLSFGALHLFVGRVPLA